MREEQIEKLRGVVRDCVSKHLYSSAIFFADKVAAVTADPADIYMQAQALYLGRHYRRAFHLLNASQIVLRDLRFRYLAAKCLVIVLLFYSTTSRVALCICACCYILVNCCFNVLLRVFLFRVYKFSTTSPFPYELLWG